MKILITTDLYKVTTNGVVTSVHNLLEELESKGHDVRVLTFSDGKESYKEDKVYYIKSVSLDFVYPNVRMPISYRNSLLSELIEWKPDVIHSQCEFFSYQFAQRIAKLTGAPLVHTYHTLYEDYVTYVIPSKWVGKRAVRKLSCIRLKKAKKIIAPTMKVYNILRSYGMKNDMDIVPSGLDLEQYVYRMNDEERAAKRMALGISKENQVILNLGRLGTEKNIEELLCFFADAVGEHNNLYFLIVGDGPAKKTLEELTEKLGISKKVIFTGMVLPTLVREYYQLADVFVSASTSETQGLTYIEAAANGLPLLCHKDTCLDEIIREGINGYQYTTKEEFLEKLNIILSSEEWRENVAKCSEQIAKEFDKAKFAETIESIYEKTLEEKIVQ